MINLTPDGKSLAKSTIFEDKCTSSPRDKFRDEVLPVFSDHHENRRSRELVAVATSLLRESGLDGTAAVKASAKVLDKSSRHYRAALTVGTTCDSKPKRKALFKGYDCLAEIQRSQRIGAVFRFDTELREWFQNLSEDIIEKLYEFEAEHSNV